MSYTERAIAALHELALCAGSLEAGARRAGFAKSYLSTLRKRKSMPLGTLERFFEAFGVDPVRFVAWAEAGAVPSSVARFGAEALDLAIKHGEPEPVRRIRLAYLRGELADAATADEITTIDAADALRDRNPRESLDASRPLAESASSVETAARALAVWGSALRVRQDLDKAQIVLWSGIRLASAMVDHLTMANLEQRAAYVAMNRGRYGFGIELAESAGQRCGDVGESDGLGRALVAQAIIHRYKGSPKRATSCYRSALRTLSEGSRTHRATAYHGLSTMLLEAGDLESAEHLAERATGLVDSTTVNGARLCWLQARIAYSREEFGRSVSKYEEAALGLRRIPGDACLVTAELVRVLLESGRVLEARSIAQGLAPILFKLDRTAAERAGALDLWRAAQEAETFTNSRVKTALQSMIRRGIRSS